MSTYLVAKPKPNVRHRHDVNVIDLDTPNFKYYTRCRNSPFLFSEGKPVSRIPMKSWNVMQKNGYHLGTVESVSKDPNSITMITTILGNPHYVSQEVINRNNEIVGVFLYDSRSHFEYQIETMNGDNYIIPLCDGELTTNSIYFFKNTRDIRIPNYSLVHWFFENVDSTEFSFTFTYQLAGKLRKEYHGVPITIKTSPNSNYFTPDMTLIIHSSKTDIPKGLIERLNHLLRNDNPFKWTFKICHSSHNDKIYTNLEIEVVIMHFTSDIKKSSLVPVFNVMKLNNIDIDSIEAIINVKHQTQVQ